jgi:uncharacterized membrane protein
MRSVLKLVLINVVLMVLVYLLLTFYAKSRLFSYDLHKFLHIFGAVIFLGNIIVTSVWIRLAERSKDPAVIRFAITAIKRMDSFFTNPGVLLIILNGLLMASTSRWNGVYGTSWIAAGLTLLTLSGILWAGILLRYQSKLAKLADSSEGDAQLHDEFFRLLHKWHSWGSITMVLPILSLVFMVVKPKLW